MTKVVLLAVACLSAVVLAGCLGGLPGLDGGSESEPVCKPPEHSDGGVPRCLISERQPDLRYLNYDSTAHNLSVEIVRNNATVVFSRSIMVQPLPENDTDQGSGMFEDVLDRPGHYTIRATMDNATTVTLTQRFGQRWYGSGKGTEWMVSISESGELDLVQRGHH